MTMKRPPDCAVGSRVQHLPTSPVRCWGSCRAFEPLYRNFGLARGGFQRDSGSLLSWVL